MRGMERDLLPNSPNGFLRLVALTAAGISPALLPDYWLLPAIGITLGTLSIFSIVRLDQPQRLSEDRKPSSRPSLTYVNSPRPAESAIGTHKRPLSSVVVHRFFFPAMHQTPEYSGPFRASSRHQYSKRR